MWAKDYLKKRRYDPVSFDDLVEEARFNPESQLYIEELYFKYQEEKVKIKQLTYSLERSERGLPLDNYYKRNSSFTTNIGVRYKLNEEGFHVQCTPGEWVEWLRTNPNLEIFRTEIFGSLITTTFLVDQVYGEMGNQDVVYETRITGGICDGKWTRANNVRDAEWNQQRAITKVLESKRKGEVVEAPKEEERKQTYGWFNYAKNEYVVFEMNEIPKGLGDYLPQGKETQKLFKSYLEKGVIPIMAYTYTLMSFLDDLDDQTGE